MEDPPIYDNNTCVCSHHFTEKDFVSSIVEEFGPKRAMLKLDAVPTVFCFLNPAKHRKLSEANKARALRCSIIEDLLKEPSTELIPVKNQSEPQETLDYSVFSVAQL